MSERRALTSGGRWRVRDRAGWAALVLLFACTGTFVLSSAVFNDTTSNDGGSLVVGTLDVAATPTSAVIAGPAMGPGDAVYGVMTVTNSGNLALRYAATVTTTEDTLASALELTIREGMTDCDGPGFAASQGTAVAGPTSLGSTAGVAVIGDPTQGAQPGDRVLAPAADEDLCLRVVLPSSVDEGALAGTTSTAVVTLAAEQSDNNP